MKKIAIISILSCLFFSSYAQERFITTSDGVKLYVNVRGEGIPCLYIHGGPGSGSHWLEKFSGEMLEKHFKMIYLDQRGVCRSTSPADSNYTMDRMVKDFEEVRVALGIDRWLTLGHSFGGILQMGYAERHPEVLEGMIMICCGLDMNSALQEVVPKACEILGVTDIKPYTDKSLSANERMNNIQNLYGQLREKDLFWEMGYSDKNSIEIMNASFDDIPKWNKDFENIAMSIDEYRANYKDETANMTMPVLFFYGNKDFMVGPNHHIGIKFPEILFWESNTGHVPFIENKPDLEKAIDSYLWKFDLE
jgi:proline iminopeptidase